MGTARIAYASTYRCWKHMRQRCLNPRNQDFKSYGGRGITICKRWSRFERFLKDLGPRPSPQYCIERIDNDGNYEKANCVWATRKQQGRNTKTVKLDLVKVAEIRTLCDCGFDQRLIAKWYGVKRSIVPAIYCGKVWT